MKAHDNPWYLLATLFGAPLCVEEPLNIRIRNANRTAWNRWHAEDLNEEAREQLIQEKRFPADELRPFSPEELQAIKARFAERCNACGNKFALPGEDGSEINFSDVDFEQDAWFHGYLFSRMSFFDGAKFFGEAIFDKATFYRIASFDDAEFRRWATFRGAAFPGRTSFRRAAFSQRASFDKAAFSGEPDMSNEGYAIQAHAQFDKAHFGGIPRFAARISPVKPILVTWSSKITSRLMG